MLAHSSLAVLATLSTTRDIHELTITLVFSSSTPASPGRLQVSLIPALPAGRLCPRPSAPAPICRQSAAGRASYSLSGSPSLPHSDDTCPSLQRIAALHFSRRRKAPHSWPAFPPAGGTIIPQSAAFRAPLLSGPVLGHPGPSLQPGRGVPYPSRRFWPSPFDPYWPNSHDFKRTCTHAVSPLLNPATSNQLYNCPGADFPGWGERDAESTSPRTETLEATPAYYSTSPWRGHPRILGLTV